MLRDGELPYPSPLDATDGAHTQFAVSRGRIIAAVNGASSGAAESFHYPSGEAR
ncbi:MAG TPA: hypothetical protein VK755_02680 [Candidatus Acidoferrales bacterium]|nr:hypothetical protein [Candidatus Acidoferrales bacterium]